MPVTIVVGSQWGDEAKGKMVDLLSEQAQIVARYNGGDNAGHTVVNRYGTFKLRLTPNGFSTPDAQCVIGPGVVLNLATLISEIKTIQQAGINLNNRLWVSPRCHVVMPYHPALEAVYEEAKGAGATGTTRRGMGPVYADKVSYNGIRLFDFANPAVLRAKLETQLKMKNQFLRAAAKDSLNLEQIFQEKLEQYAEIRQYVHEPFGMIQDTLINKGQILLEAAQGSLLDNDWGTYPFVTASTTISGGAAGGLGIAPRWITRVIGVAKAYTTRVGAGPMPTELLDADGDALRNAGAEFGTVTGRPRRCGWFDAALVRFTSQLNGCTELALTKLDVLDQLPVIKICIGYQHTESSQDLRQYWEGDAAWLSEVKPVYIEMPGWQKPTTGVRQFTDLPPEAQAYVHKAAELTDTKISFVSVGPERDSIIRIA